jgi:hypothetical protein
MKPAIFRAPSTATPNLSTTKKGKEVRLIHPITVKGIIMVALEGHVEALAAREDLTQVAAVAAEVSPLA